MKLKKLELFGFKSFAEKTEIVFEDGINVIVGPNGCGKSNVVDALKWVLGEQSVKSLRGNEMIDVIFNGTEKRPSLGYAEVSLTIQNNRGLLPLEYTEVCITRRLYTSGESEYLINKQASRLKDIRGLFLDTGFGFNAYSVIEQGNVDVLLRADAKERRLLFEEAAGISKFKAQKKSALLKLEQVEQNLLRVGDIIEELQKQLRSVKLQASKARKYQGYTEQLKKLRMGISLKNYRDLKQKQAEIQDQINRVKEQYTTAAADIHQLETQINEVEEIIDQRKQQSSHLQTESFNLEAQLLKKQDKTKYNAERIHDLDVQREKHRQQQDGLESRTDETKNKIAETKENFHALEQELLNLTDTLKVKETAHEQIKLECDLLSQGIEEKKAEVITILQKGSTIQNEIGGLSNEKESLKNRKLRLFKRQEEIDSVLDSLQAKHQEMLLEKNILTEERSHLDLKLSTSKGRIQELVDMARSLEEQINQQKRVQSSKTSRHEILMDYEMRAEGVDAGARTILEEAKKEGSVLQGIRGMIADMIKVDLPYALAIETALGEKVQGIVTDTTENALQALLLLKEQQKGNAKFLPLDRLTGNESIPGEILEKTDVIGSASQLVNCSEENRSVIHGFLQNTVVVKNIHAALSLGDSTNTLRYVTLEGELLEPEGTISGGNRQGQMGIISRKSELQKIEEELKQIQHTVEDLEQEKHFRMEELSGLEEETAQLTKRIDQISILKISKENELEKNEHKQDELTTEKKINAGEAEEIEVEIENTNERERTLQEELLTLHQQRQQLEQQVEESVAMVKEKELMGRGVQNELTTLKVTLAQKQEKRESLHNALNNYRVELQEIQDQITFIMSEIQNCQNKKVETEEESKNLEIQINELQGKKVELEESMATLKIDLEGLVHSVSELKGRYEEKRAEREQVEHQLQEFKLRENECTIRMTNLEERVREEYKLEIVEIDAQTDKISLELSTTNITMDETEPTVFWDAVSKEIEELQGKIERLGNVNLEAIDELNELEIRETFLINQKDDLEKSYNSLHNLIKKINHTSRELFEKVFYEIRQNFQVMFRKLFGGGKADILIEENVDILEAGIEIVAQPPNKELRSLTLLSGGEKVMATVALLFSVFQTKPSPFCILDEVDAALDESNINRFAHIVKEFTEDTQFLMITHNKVTMGIANVMYGITMQEPGVSKKIAVKFEEIERKVA